MDKNDFFEEDETLEELLRSWRDGIPGTTAGTRQLDKDSQSIVDAAAKNFDAMAKKID